MKKLLTIILAACAICALQFAIADDAKPVVVTVETKTVATVPPLKLSADQTKAALGGMAKALADANIVTIPPELSGQVRGINIQILPDGSSVTRFTLKQ